MRDGLVDVFHIDGNGDDNGFLSRDGFQARGMQQDDKIDTRALNDSKKL